MRTLQGFALLTAAACLVAGCSGSSSGGSSSPTPITSKSAPTPTPTFTQLGTLAISHVLKTRHLTPGAECPSVAQAFPNAAGKIAACDRPGRKVYLLAPPALDQLAVEATTVAREPGGGNWTVYIQLSKSGAGAFALVGAPYAIVYNGVVVNVPSQPSITPGGYLQIQGLSKQKAKRIAAALNPS